MEKIYKVKTVVFSKGLINDHLRRLYQTQGYTRSRYDLSMNQVE